LGLLEFDPSERVRFGRQRVTRCLPSDPRGELGAEVGPGEPLYRSESLGVLVRGLGDVISRYPAEPVLCVEKGEQGLGARGRKYGSVCHSDPGDRGQSRRRDRGDLPPLPDPIYRHFPIRADLVIAVYRHQIEACAEADPILLAGSDSPLAALRRWVDLFVDFLVTKHGLANALQSDSSGFDALHTYFLDRLVPVCRAG
jgi:hypothetical protein